MRRSPRMRSTISNADVRDASGTHETKDFAGPAWETGVSCQRCVSRPSRTRWLALLGLGCRGEGVRVYRASGLPLTGYPRLITIVINASDRPQTSKFLDQPVDIEIAPERVMERDRQPLDQPIDYDLSIEPTPRQARVCSHARAPATATVAAMMSTADAISRRPRIRLTIPRDQSLRGRFEIGCQACSSSSSTLASFRSSVSKPSVNQP